MVSYTFMAAVLIAGFVIAARGLLPMLALRLKLGTLLAADASTLAPAVNANKLALIIAPFTQSENLTIGSLTLATGGGLAPVVGVAGPQETGVDPVTLQQVITISSPAGGFRWVSSGGGPYPITVYGFALVDNGVASLLGVQPFVPPISLSADGQFIDADPADMTFVMQPIS